jgi:hypothetical protein
MAFESAEAHVVMQQKAYFSRVRPVVKDKRERPQYRLIVSKDELRRLAIRS